MGPESHTIGPVYVHGAGEEERPPLRLRAGPMSLLFEPETAFLRSIALHVPTGGRREVLRGIYVAVRDHNWNTLAPEIAELSIEETPTGFSVQFEARCGGGVYAWKGAVTGDASGRLRFEMDGIVEASFRRNRIGFCVLHPAECAGRACAVEAVDGARRRGVFPRHISPRQPFTNLRAITHDVEDGVQAEVRFEGDTFEMEDQRNWTDASFKTYSTPLELPFPIEVEKGDTIRQAVEVTLRGLDSLRIPKSSVEATDEADRRLLITPGDRRRLPAVGLGASSDDQHLTDTELQRLSALGLGHLRVDCRARGVGWRERFRSVAEEARALGVRLEVALFLSSGADDELALVKDALRQTPTPVSTFLVFDEQGRAGDERRIRLVRRILERGEAIREARVASGTNVYFAQFNRDRPAIELLDAVCYSLNPQVHVFDNQSLVEALRTQGTTVESAREFCGELPVLVTPVTLRPRFNPTATTREPEPAAGELPSQVDPRQLSLFGAGWTLGSVKHLTAGRAAGITFYETVGWRGVMERRGGSRLPEKFPSVPGSVFPIYHVLADVGEFAGGEALECESSHPSEFEGLVLEKGGRRRVLIASYIGDSRTVNFADLDSLSALVSRLDTNSIEEAMRSPEVFRARVGERIEPSGGRYDLSVPPYSILRIDLEERDHERQ